MKAGPRQAARMAKAVLQPVATMIWAETIGAMLIEAIQTNCHMAMQVAEAKKSAHLLPDEAERLQLLTEFVRKEDVGDAGVAEAGEGSDPETLDPP